MKTQTLTRSLILGFALTLTAGTAIAQENPPGGGSGECNAGRCGTPKQDGGGGCGCGCGCSILVNMTDMGDTYSSSDDFDGDGSEDDFDNCPFVANRDQFDGDGDTVGDGCDNAASLSNADQLDTDGDGLGDIADPDVDGDAVLNAADNCGAVYNPSQKITLGGALGDACNGDDDLDGLLDAEDPCPKLANVSSGAGCDDDEDLDGILDGRDNCASIANPDQKNVDGDVFGDGCDVDLDEDGILNNLDNAPEVANADQLDLDRDGLGDVDDPVFCYVFEQGAATSCLNPLDTFKVGGLAIGPMETGKALNLKLFANRVDAAIDYSWTVTKRPDSSETVVRNATGKVATSLGGFEYRYLVGNEAEFVPDEPGVYEITVTANLVFQDTVIPGGSTIGKFVVPVEVGGESQGGNAGGCSTGSGTASAAGLGLLAVAFALVSRRRK